MNDVISRQAAIDAINALHDKPNAWLDCAVDAVITLPSAQPEHKTEDFVKLTVRNSNGRPYYSIIYLEDGNEFEGYSSYSLDVISDYLRRYFGFAQPECKTGRWEYVDYGGVGNYHCTACREICICNGDYNFCPNCGAKMLEDGES